MMVIHEQSDGGLEVVTGHFEVICPTNGAPKTSKGYNDATARNVNVDDDDDDDRRHRCLRRATAEDDDDDDDKEDDNRGSRPLRRASPRAPTRY